MNLCASLLNRALERVSEGLIAALLLNARLDDLALIGGVIDEDLRHLALLEVLALGQFDGAGLRCFELLVRVESQVIFHQKELFVESGASDTAQNTMNLLLGRLDLAVEAFVTIFDARPVLMAHVCLLNATVFNPCPTDGLIA